MARVISLTQFVFVSLGTMALTILVKTQPDQGGGLAQQLRAFLVQYGLWMLLIPVIWTFVAEITQYASSDKRTLGILQASGVIIAAAVLVLYSWLVLTF